MSEVSKEFQQLVCEGTKPPSVGGGGEKKFKKHVFGTGCDLYLELNLTIRLEFAKQILQFTLEPLALS